MTDALNGMSIAVLVANSGVEQVELTTPWQAIENAGGHPTLVAPSPGKVQAFCSDVEAADTFAAEIAASDVAVDNYAALVLPGGTTNPDKLRLVPAAMSLVSEFVEASKPVAAICHGPWSLVEADVLRGKTLTSWPSLRTDITNAGGTWVDEEVFVCTANGWTLVTSRKPDDLDAFTAAMLEQFEAAS